MNILYGILIGFLAQIFSFLQLQGAIKYGWYGKYLWLILLFSIPLSWLYIQSVQRLIAGFGGEIWPSRLIGFGIGIIVFSLMSHYLFKEPLSSKTLTCLGLGMLIILIQIFWK